MAEVIWRLKSADGPKVNLHPYLVPQLGWLEQLRGPAGPLFTHIPQPVAQLLSMASQSPNA